MRVFLIYGGMCGARVMVNSSLDRWPLSGHEDIGHFTLT